MSKNINTDPPHSLYCVIDSTCCGAILYRHLQRIVGFCNASDCWIVFDSKNERHEIPANRDPFFFYADPREKVLRRKLSYSDMIKAVQKLESYKSFFAP